MSTVIFGWQDVAVFTLSAFRWASVSHSGHFTISMVPNTLLHLYLYVGMSACLMSVRHQCLSINCIWHLTVNHLGNELQSQQQDQSLTFFLLLRPIGFYLFPVLQVWLLWSAVLKKTHRQPWLVFVRKTKLLR